MTRLFPDETCTACGSLLVPPELASGFSVPRGTDYVCLKCGRPYQWTKGNPQRLTLLVVAEKRDADDESDD
jgi:hypothetical protein